MLANGKDELICDLAETYGVMDMWALSVPLLATLASGLRENSRSKLKLNGEKADLGTTLKSLMVDYLGMLTWIIGGARREGVPRPQSVTDIVQGRQRRDEEKINDSGLRVFDTPNDFDEAWKKLTGG